MKKKYGILLVILFLALGGFFLFKLSSKFEGTVEKKDKAEENIVANYFDDGVLDLKDFIRSASFKDVEGNTMKGIEQPSDLSTIYKDVEVELDYEIPLDLLYYETNEWDGRVRYEIPADVISNYPSVDGEVKQNDVVVGSYTIENNILDIQFFEEQLSIGSVVIGDFFFWADLDYSDQLVSGEKKYIFSERAVVGIPIHLYTELVIDKTATTPIADYTENVVDFGYKIAISSPAGTRDYVTVNDVLSVAYSSTGISLNDISVVWKDVDGKIKDIVDDDIHYGLEISNNKNLVGNLPKMAPGDSYEITYRVREKFRYDLYGTYTERNEITVGVNGANSLTDSVSSSIKFEGVRHDVYVSKSGTRIDNGLEQEYKFTITVSSTYGTNGKPIVIDDYLTRTYRSSESRVVKNLIVKDKNNNDITSSVGFTINNNLSTSATSSYIDVFEGTLPALEAGGKYTITYSIVDTFALDSGEGTVGVVNYVKVTSDDISDYDSETESAYEYFEWQVYKYSSGFNSNVTDYTASFKLKWYMYLQTSYNNNGKLDLDGYSITDEVQNDFSNYTHQLDNSVDITINRSTYSSSYFSDLAFPISFERRNGTLIMIDGNGTENDIGNDVRNIYMSYNSNLVCNYNNLVSCNINKDVYNYAKLLYKGSQTGSSSYYNHIVQYECDPSVETCPCDPNKEVCPDPPTGPSLTIEKKYRGMDATNDKLVLNWITDVKWTSEKGEGITSELPVGFTFTDKSTSSITSDTLIDSYFTKEQISNITVGSFDNTYYDVLVSGVEKDGNGNLTPFTDLDSSAVSENGIITSFKIVFKRAVSGEKVDFTVTYSTTYDSTVLVDNQFVKINNLSTATGKTKSNKSASADSDANAYYKKVPDKTVLLILKENYISSGNTNKDHDMPYSGSQYLYYKVTLNEYSSTEGDITFTDVLPEGTSLVNSTWSGNGLSCSSSNCSNGVIIKQYDYATGTEVAWNNVASANVSYDSATRKLTVSVAEEDLENDEGYKAPLILYYRVNVASITSDKTYVNNATIVDDEVSASDSAEVTLRVHALDKSFVNYESTTNLVSYDVFINKSKSQLGNGTVVKFKDTLSFPSGVNEINLKSIELYEISDSGSETKVDNFTDYDVDTSASYSTVVNFTVPDKTYYKVRFVYEIFFSSSLYNTNYTLTNSVVPTNSSVVGLSASVSNTISEPSKLVKYGNGYDVVNNIVKYRLSVNATENIGNKVIDYVDYSNYSSYIESIEINRIYLTEPSSKTEINFGKDEWYTTSDNGSRLTITMDVLEGRKYDIHIEYKLKFKSNDGFSFNMYNYAHLDSSYPYDFASVYISESTKASKTFVNYDNKNNRLNYFIKYNANAEDLVDDDTISLNDKLDYSSYTDVISNVDLASMKIYKLVSGSKGEEVTDLGDWYEVTNENGVLNVDMNIPDNNAYYIEYSYELEYDKFDTVDITLNNSLTAEKASPINVSGRVLENVKLEKRSGIYNERNNTLAYSVIINPNSEKLVDGNKYTLIDELDYNNFAGKIVRVEVQDIKLYNYVDGSKSTEVTDLEEGWYTEEDSDNIHKLLIELDDNKAYYLEYTYKFIYNGATLFNAELSNKVYVSGVAGAMWNDSVASIITRYGSMATALTDAYLLNIVKVDAGNTEKRLANASYELEKYNGTDWQSLGIFTTEADGASLIGEASKGGNVIMYLNTLYRLKEVTAPNGYRINPDYQYVYNYNSAFEEELYPEGFDLTQALEIVNSNVYLKDEVEEKNPETNDMLKVGGAIIIFLLSLLLIYLINKKYA